MNVEIGAESALFPEKEYIKGICVAVWVRTQTSLKKYKKGDISKFYKFKSQRPVEY
jgi:hypothetical protein